MSFILNKLRKEAVIFCPLCNKDYRPANLRIVDQVGETILAHSSCPHCAGSILSLLFNNVLGMSLIGLVTDLIYEDALKIKGAPAVATDEVLGLYETLWH